MVRFIYITISLFLISLTINGQENNHVEIFEGRGTFDSKVILDLSYQNLKSVPIEADNPEIEVLILDNNNLEKLPVWISNLKNLKVLSVRNNNLKSAKSISYCTNLEQLYLSGNKELADLANLSSCKKLKLIDVIDTKINDVPGWIQMMDDLLYFKHSK
ncbi:MAG: leucine-rich repeat domain-containing protein [Bacteroidales bacterium]|jgi:Leucine-rich repeat (LRR) protein|nr:leucine-rich repeat domain-containing protein [Bacteroidales bacterium]